MNRDELFYLRDTRTGKYKSPTGWVEGHETASEFTELQLKRLLKVAKTHTKRFREKLANGFMAMEPLVEKEPAFQVFSDIEYDDNDILLCDGTYYYGKDLFKQEVIYCRGSGVARTPKDKKGEPDRIVFRVKSKHGKRNPGSY